MVTVHIENPGSARHCGACTLCCRLVPVSGLHKPAGVRCKHQSMSAGCRIYDQRPGECRMWSCRWLADPAASVLRRPDRTHYVVDALPDEVMLRDNVTGEVQTVLCMQVWVDTGYPEAYRDPALYAYIEHVAAAEGLATMIRWDNLRCRVIVAPCLNAAGKWVEKEGGTPSFKVGRFHNGGLARLQP